VILANVTDPNECLELDVNFSITVNVKNADFSTSDTLHVRAYSSVNNPTPAAPVSAVMNAAGFGISLVGYSLDIKYSEENLRKSNVAIRSHYRTMDWEIPVGRNYIVDYALNEALPEYIMANITEAISLGQDHRAIDVIIKTLIDVYDRGREENEDPNFREDIQKLGFDYVASQQVRPVVYIGTIDLEEVDTIRSSDVLGDIRQYVELQLINLFSLLHQNSYYKTQLNAGEKPLYKLLTSEIILANLLNVPHIHNHLQDASYGENFDGDSVEYRRVLPSGVILECVSTTFDYMRDKIVIIPYRQGDSESILSFGHNLEFGTYLAHYNPQIANGVNKRVFANAREIVLPTNPLGMYLQVVNISKTITVTDLVNPIGTSGDDLPDLKSRIASDPRLSGNAGPASRIWAKSPLADLPVPLPVMTTDSTGQYVAPGTV
jgi:hypothetical protein